MKKIWWQSGSGRIELQIPESAIPACSHSGSCDDDVSAWYRKIGWSKVSRETLEQELKEYGAWDDLKIADTNTLKQRMFWIACGDLADNARLEYVD